MGLDDPKFVIDFVRKCSAAIKQDDFGFECPFDFEGKERTLKIHSKRSQNFRNFGTLKERVVEFHTIYIHVRGFFTLDVIYTNDLKAERLIEIYWTIDYTKFDTYKLRIAKCSDRETVDHLMTVFTLMIGA